MLFFIISLISYFILNTFSSSFLVFYNIKKKFNISFLKKLSPTILIFLKKSSPKDFFVLLFISKQIVILLFAFATFIYFSYLNITISILITLSILLFTDAISRFLANIYYKKLFFISSVISSIFVYLLLPISYPLYKAFKMFSLKIKNQFFSEENLLDIIQSEETNTQIDKKILSSLVTFKKKVAREVMTPRIDVFSLSKDLTIQEAIKQNVEENYSRIPIHKDTKDQIIGILMYKDILKLYTKHDKNLDAKIETLITPVLYVPENKKIFRIFNEFREKKLHMAIVVNEYGNAEGIITIEDILEELVGEIEDEYDINEQKQYQKLPDNSWVIDGKMSIIDIEKKLNINIPRSIEYETIGGFIFHRAGFIPKKGWSLHLDDFDIQILSSNERCIEKIKIIFKEDIKAKLTL